jgi:hypothetical protein
MVSLGLMVWPTAPAINHVLEAQKYDSVSKIVQIGVILLHETRRVVLHRLILKITLFSV